MKIITKESRHETTAIDPLPAFTILEHNGRKYIKTEFHNWREVNKTPDKRRGYLNVFCEQEEIKNKTR